MKNKKYFILGLIPLGALLLLALFTFLLPARSFSPNENRYLAQLPQVSPQAVAEGNFQKDLDAFLSDQVPFRDFWIRANTAMKKLSGRREINGVYLGKDHRYFQAFTDDSYSVSRMEGIFRIMEDFNRAHGRPAALLLVPSPGTILREELPANAPFYDEAPVYEAAASILSCPVVDLREAFRSAPDPGELYYATDHHWTTQGAMVAREAYGELVGLEPRDFYLEPVSRNFYGTLHSKVLDGAAEPDTILSLRELPEVTVTRDEKEPSASPYFPEFLEKKDQYAYFFGGNWGTVKITTGQDTGRRLLVIKDSFANAFVPFLFADYDEICMVDLRYFRGDLQALLEEEGTTEVLFLYEVTNLLTDGGILHLEG